MHQMAPERQMIIVNCNIFTISTFEAGFFLAAMALQRTQVAGICIGGSYSFGTVIEFFFLTVLCVCVCSNFIVVSECVSFEPEIWILVPSNCVISTG